ncbi:MAG: tetratricopeptide repeat protein, partial [Deltaproteobacteria bacterium]|nr:tetratricopeptide repeat protein [Deltaproteobacteria bacterium]
MRFQEHWGIQTSEREARVISERESTEAEKLFERGIALYDKGRFDEAIPLFDMALGLNPNLSE